MRGILSGYGNVWENMFWVGQKPFENFVVGYMIFFSGTFSNNFSFSHAMVVLCKILFGGV